MTRTEASGGFTLVEVLVALTLLGLISVALVTGLRFGARAWERGDTRLTAVHEVAAVRAFLARSLAQGLPGEGARQRLHAGWDGAPARLAFTTPGPHALDPAGAVRLTLAAEPGPDGRRLVVSWGADRPRPRTGAAVPETRGPGRILLRGLSRVRFRYYGADGDAPPRWRDTWSADRTPWLVAIEIAFAAADRPPWPTLVVAPRTATPAADRLGRGADATGRPAWP